MLHPRVPHPNMFFLLPAATVSNCSRRFNLPMWRVARCH